MFSPEPRDRNGGVVKRGSVMVARIEGVMAGVEQFAELHRLIGLVRVHRPAAEIVCAQPERRERDKNKRQLAQKKRKGGCHGWLDEKRNAARCEAKNRLALTGTFSTDRYGFDLCEFLFCQSCFVCRTVPVGPG